MTKHIILNFALLNNAGTWTKVQHCTAYADAAIEVMQFDTDAARDKYITDNNIVIIEQAEAEPV